MNEEERKEECSCGVPEGSIVTAVLTMVEYLHPESGELMLADFSHDGSDNPLTLAKVRELTDRLVLEYQAPLMADIIAEMVAAMLFADEEMDEE